MRIQSLALILSLTIPGAAMATPQRFSPPPIAPKVQAKIAQPQVAAGEPKFFPLGNARLNLPRNTKPLTTASAKAPARTAPPAFEMPKAASSPETAGMTPEMAQQLLSIYPTLD